MNPDVDMAAPEVLRDNQGQKRKAMMNSVSGPRKRLAVARDVKQETKKKSDIILKTTPLNSKTMAKLGSIAFNRIIESEAGAAQGGESNLRVQILANLATKRPLSDSLITGLIAHISADFQGRIGLALQWLYAEWTAQPDGKRYHAVLREVLGAMRSKLKASDKLLTMFLLKVPQIPNEVYDVLHDYCLDTMAPERMHMGLCTLRDLALQRPPCRSAVLSLLLKYTVHQNESLRMAAIRLVTTHLVPSPTFVNPILTFATKLLRSLITEKNESEKKEDMDIETKEEKNKMEEDIDINEPKNESDFPEGTGEEEKKEKASETKKGESGFDDEDIKRRLLLYFHLCAKRPELLNGLVEVYCKVDAKSKQMIHRQSGSFIRSIGMTSPALLTLIKNFPLESKTFILGVLHLLTEAQSPTTELVSIVKEVYENRTQDPRFLIPIIPGLTKSELLNHLPKLIDLSSNSVKTVINRILLTKSSLSPSELLIALHLMDTKSVPLKKAREAIQLCFEQKTVTRQEVLAKALQQLVDTNPVPPLFLWTVMQAVAKCKQMTAFVMGLLHALIVKQLWNDKLLWQGFMKCCKMTLPASIPILLQLPPAQFEETLQKAPPLVEALFNFQKKNPKQIPKNLQSILASFESKTNKS
uniref:Symplekin C-terminal domain-containing protein n=2 Tax=Arcella intermedia TaxID=1963864 RepID=A0A6B2KZG1_9EUKA